MATYKVKDLPGLNDLHVVGELRLDTTVGTVVEVSEFVNTGVVIGDRLLRFPVPPHAVFISVQNLDEVDIDANQEFASDNPYGAFKYEGRFTKGNLTITHSVFEQAVSITIYETETLGPDTTNYKTLYTASFFQQAPAALELVEDMLHSNLDPDDLIFELQKLKENDYNG